MLVTKKSSIAGTGCFTTTPIRKGGLVGEYTGELITDAEAEERYSEKEETYIFEVGKNLVIDAINDPNPIKYINHSCDPNCESEQKGKRIFIRALRSIKAGEELTYDYNLKCDPDDDDECACSCGTRNCRKTMRAK